MRNRFGEQLERLHVEMIQMGALCEDAISAAAQALMKGDEDLARAAGEAEREIDQKVVELVKAQHEKAVRILTDNRAKLDELAQYLYQKETITGEEFMEILNREPAQAQ